MNFLLELAPAARRDLKKLPINIQKDVVFMHLPHIQSDPYRKGVPLTGTFKGERSYHFGRKPEYRIIYFIEGNKIIVTIIGSRENIYKTAHRKY